MALFIHACQLDSQAMASTTPGLLPGPPFNQQVPLAPYNEQAGVMPTPALGYHGMPMQMGITPAAWHQYQQALAHAYNAAALGTAPMLPPVMAGAMPPPFATMGTPMLPPMPGTGMLAAPTMPLPHPTAPMYVR